MNHDNFVMGMMIGFILSTILVAGLFGKVWFVWQSEMDKCEQNLPRTQHCEWVMEAHPIQQ